MEPFRAGGAPAEGERRAVRNLSAQYRVAAALTFKALRRADLEWVRLVDPEAGRLDDILIACPGRFDAYQIEWSDYQGTVTFRELTTRARWQADPIPPLFGLWPTAGGSFA